MVYTVKIKITKIHNKLNTHDILDIYHGYS